MMPSQHNRAKMSRNKPETSLPEVNYAEIKFANSQQKRRQGKMNPSRAAPSEEQISYVELKFHRAPESQPGKRGDQHPRRGTWRDLHTRPAPRSAPWRLTAGILATSCILLMGTVAVLLTRLFSRQGEQTRKALLDPQISPKNEECSCHPSARSCFRFGNSSYQVFDQWTTWEASSKACAELNSHLLRIDSEEELEILSTLEIKGWISFEGVRRNRTAFWTAERLGTQTVVDVQEWTEHHCPYLKGSYIYPRTCSLSNDYTCECHAEVIREPGTGSSRL
ncbi:PREDICTED: NKG2-C type II integral membrane protein-like [Dipodomys ordii]|uniref:NKG2-C type II integral membrane protein-like n=1 Tax=Dipodomys ordii TaxID=10020 RepID=A0A1S3GTV5_DIPOR|nr:PREDICTED: NKG2-C type II integral membrane protein-like [Dipodomys ordii]